MFRIEDVRIEYECSENMELRGEEEEEEEAAFENETDSAEASIEKFGETIPESQPQKSAHSSSSAHSFENTHPSIFRTIVVIILPLLSILGFYGTHFLSAKNGLYKELIGGLSAASPVFPGTNDAMVWNFTWIGPIDKQLRTLVAFFAPVVDPANVEINLFCIFGVGQFGAAWALLMLEGMRRGNNGLAVSYIGTLGLLIQNIAFTVTLPLYLFLHLLTSPVGKYYSVGVSNAIIVSESDMALIHPALTYGYILPSLLMLLPPSIVSSFTHQKLIAFWQPFPLWTALMHWAAKTCIKSDIVSGLTTKKRKPAGSPGAAYISSVHVVYGFVIFLSALTHISTALIILIPASILPASTPDYIIRLFSCSFSDVFVPQYLYPSQQVPSLAAGVLSFLQWDVYIGSFAFLLWGMLLCRNAVEGTVKWASALGTIGLWLLLSGPMGALGMLLWERDSVVKDKIKDGE